MRGWKRRGVDGKLRLREAIQQGCSQARLWARALLQSLPSPSYSWFKGECVSCRSHHQWPCSKSHHLSPWAEAEPGTPSWLPSQALYVWDTGAKWRAVLLKSLSNALAAEKRGQGRIQSLYGRTEVTWEEAGGLRWRGGAGPTWRRGAGSTVPASGCLTPLINREGGAGARSWGLGWAGIKPWGGGRWGSTLGRNRFVLWIVYEAYQESHERARAGMFSDFKVKAAHQAAASVGEAK